MCFHKSDSVKYLCGFLPLLPHASLPSSCLFLVWCHVVHSSEHGHSQHCRLWQHHPASEQWPQELQGIWRVFKRKVRRPGLQHAPPPPQTGNHFSCLSFCCYWACLCYSVYVEVRGHLCAVGSLFIPLHGFQGLNSDCWAPQAYHPWVISPTVHLLYLIVFTSSKDPLLQGMKWSKEVTGTILELILICLLREKSLCTFRDQWSGGGAFLA